jgi:NAD(P)-dependent dehydrogenase (short-subunit alcohol dehydrogenase family)
MQRTTISCLRSQLDRGAHLLSCGPAFPISKAMVESSTFVQGPPGFGTYVAGKSAIAGLTKVAAREWGPKGITVNAICPFAMSPGMEAYFSDPERLEEALAARSIKRVGDPERDIGRAAVFLAGPDSSYITGSTLMVDGGGDFLG